VREAEVGVRKRGIKERDKCSGAKICFVIECDSQVW